MSTDKRSALSQILPLKQAVISKVVGRGVREWRLHLCSGECSCEYLEKSLVTNDGSLSPTAE